jgi:hypothetical protein
MTAFWDIVLCSLTETDRPLRGTGCHLHTCCHENLKYYIIIGLDLFTFLNLSQFQSENVVDTDYYHYLISIVCICFRREQAKTTIVVVGWLTVGVGEVGAVATIPNKCKMDSLLQDQR